MPLTSYENYRATERKGAADFVDNNAAFGDIVVC